MATTPNSAYPVVKGALVSTENYTWNTADSLGKGASAVVYLGRHKATGKYAAVKVFHEHVYHGYKMDDLRELELLRQLDHPNVIRLLAVEKLASSSKMVIVVEFCEGGSLHHMLDQPQYYYGLPQDEFLLVLHDVCSGMEYLQQKSVIHRDIKPGNIMRSIKSDGLSEYKLTDFGAARNLSEDESFQSLYGTEEYLHPGMYERAVLKLPNSQAFDAKVDLWSLGVTFYHIATGQLPFKPFGGRSNRRTMFEIITQKESGVISGIQSTANGPIQWKRDLPESSPLSNGLKSMMIPLLAGLMEPDSNKMISYQSLFRMVNNIIQKVPISIFYFNKCEELEIFAEPTMALSGLQDLIASRTDILASDQILLFGGKTLEEIVDPLCNLRDYPYHLRNGSICLFQKEMTEVYSICEPEILPIPAFTLTDMDADARLAQSCSAWGELIKKTQEKIIKYQDRLISGLMFLRLYVENRLETTRVSLDYVKLLMAECKGHIDTIFDLGEILREFVVVRGHNHFNVALLNTLLDGDLKRFHETANVRMNEIEAYSDNQITKMEDIKSYTNTFVAECSKNKCMKKMAHHLSVVTGVYNRFRRDRNVRSQMTAHDVDIHRFEGQKLHDSCVIMKSILIDHCLPQLRTVYKNSIHVCESLTKSLARVVKIEKNLAAVQNFVTIIVGKFQSLKNFRDMSEPLTGASVAEDDLRAADTASSFSGTVGSEVALFSPAGSVDRHIEGVSDRATTSLTQNVSRLKKTLDLVTDILKQNSNMLHQSLEEAMSQNPNAFSQ